MPIQDRIIADPGLERGVARLTREDIARAVAEVFRGETGARLKVYLETCVRCGMCAPACHYFVSHDGDPSYSPVAKVRQTLGQILKYKGAPPPEIIYQCAQLAYTECNLCRRCLHYCPLGIDTAYLMTVVRRLCHKLGVTPLDIQDSAHSHSAVSNQMWIRDDEWPDTLQWLEEEGREEHPGLRIPLEKEGARVMYSVIGPEPKVHINLISQAAVIMHAAGTDWTMPATPGWDNSNLAMFSGDHEVMARVERAHYEAAQRLKVERIVMGECGHAFRAVYDVGNRWLGWRTPPVPVIHAIQFYWELMNEGRIRAAKAFPEPVTIHDPCNVIRGRGLTDKLREVARAFAPDIVEMRPNKDHNFCCCAGGGVVNCGSHFKPVRTAGNRIKADQIRATGVRTVIAPCHNCHVGLQDISAHYGLDVKVIFLSDLIFQCMDKSAVAAAPDLS